MRWGTYLAVSAAVISVGLALGVSLPLVSLRLDSWGYGSFAIGVMAALSVGRGQCVLMQAHRLFGPIPEHTQRQQRRAQVFAAGEGHVWYLGK
jgi:hypothetical protein